MKVPITRGFDPENVIGVFDLQSGRMTFNEGEEIRVHFDAPALAYEFDGIKDTVFKDGIIYASAINVIGVSIVQTSFGDPTVITEVEKGEESNG